MYSKRTLKKAYEMPFAALFVDNRGQKKYEASSVIVVSKLEDSFVVVRIEDIILTTIHIICLL